MPNSSRKPLLVVSLIVLALSVCGCTPRSSTILHVSECPYCEGSYRLDDFESHLWQLSYSPEDAVSLRMEYNRTEDLEDAFTKLYCYLYEEDDVTWNEADDAWIYVSHYIDALHADLDELYSEYKSIR